MTPDKPAVVARIAEKWGNLCHRLAPGAFCNIEREELLALVSALAEAEARAVKAETEAAGRWEQLQRYRGEAVEEILSERTRADAAEKALERYGLHLASCPLNEHWNTEDDGDNCTCGLTAAKRGAKP